jgi:hypothetical protein
MLAEQEAYAHHNPSPYSPNFDDGTLRALLAHEPISKRPTILGFFRELYSAKEEDDQRWVSKILRLAIQRARSFAPATLPGQGRSNPSDGDFLHHVALYTANLCTLIATISPEGVPIAQMAPPASSAEAWWRSAVRLWRSTLDNEGWLSLTHAIFVGPKIDSGQVALSQVTHLYAYNPDTHTEPTRNMGAFFAELDPSEAEAYLLGDRQLAAWITSGRVSWWREEQVSGPGARAHHQLLGMRSIDRRDWDELYLEISKVAYDGFMSAATLDLLSVCLARDAYYLSEENLIRCLRALSMRRRLCVVAIAKCVAAKPKIATLFAKSPSLLEGVNKASEDARSDREAATVLRGLLQELRGTPTAKAVSRLMTSLGIAMAPPAPQREKGR